MPDYAPVNGADLGSALTYTAGAPVTGGQVVVFSAPDTVIPAAGPSLAFAGVAGHDASTGAPVTVHAGAGVFHETPSTGLGPPPAPGLATAGAGGTVLAGVYQVALSYVNAAGETVAGPAAPVTTAGATSTITIASPAAAPGATGWYAYCSQLGLTALTRQQAPGAPTAIGTPLVLTAPPINTGLAPQAGNTSGPVAGALLQAAAGGLVAGGAAAGAEIGVAVRGVPAASGVLRWKTTRG